MIKTCSLELELYQSLHATRTNSLKLTNTRCHYDLRKIFFSCRIVNIWNTLPSEVVNVSSLNSFKNRLDRFWMNQDQSCQGLETGSGRRALTARPRRWRHWQRGADVSSPLEVGSGEGLCPLPENFLIFELKKVSFGAFWVLFLQLNWMETAYIYKMREILTMRWVSGRWSPKCGSLPLDVGDLVGLQDILYDWHAI